MEMSGAQHSKDLAEEEEEEEEICHQATRRTREDNHGTPMNEDEAVHR